MLVLCGSSVDAQESAPSPVRVLPGILATTLEEGARASSTLRGLIDELQQSDLIVHVTGVPLRPNRRIAGTTRFISATGGHRYLRITVDERLPPLLRAAILAHELQHAVEVARTPRVLDVRSFAQLYRHIGRPTCACVNQTCYETTAARRTEAQVLFEMRRATADATATARQLRSAASQ